MLEKSIKAPLTLVIALLFSVVLVLFSGPNPANASTQVDGVDEMRDFFDEYGVERATQDELIAEYLAGGSWDSFSSDSVAIETSKSLESGFEVTVNRFDDGSVSVTRIEQPTSFVAPGSVTPYSSPHGCTASGKVRTNCTVDAWVGAVALSFKANYNLGTNKVTSVYSAGWTVVGSCNTSIVYFGIPVSNRGQLDLSAQMCGVGYSTTFHLWVTVSNGVATEGWN